MEQVIRSTSSIDANLAASLIREAKSAAFKSRAIGIGAAIGIPGLGLSLGAAAMLWAHNQSVDPEMLKAALASVPSLKVEGTVKAMARSGSPKVLPVKLQDGSTVNRADGSVVTVTGAIPAQAPPPMIMPSIKTRRSTDNQNKHYGVEVLPHGDGKIISGWVFPSGNAKSP